MEIKLITLSMKQFKGCESRTVQFGGLNTAIYGDNGTGKTTIYDGFSWLLFDKNSEGQSSFEMKPVDTDRPEVTVEGIIKVDGKQIELKKILTETWTKKRGEETETFTGHTTSYWINKIPKKVGEYKAFIDAIVTEEKFKRLTSAGYFLSLKKPEMRSILINMAGNVNDRAVAGEDIEQVALVDLMQEKGYSIDDLLKLVKQNVKLYSDEQKNISPRIDEQRKYLTGEVKDYTELEKGLAKGSEYLTTLDAKLADTRTYATEIAQKYRELHETRNKIVKYTEEKLRVANEDRIVNQEKRTKLLNEMSVTKAKSETAAEKENSLSSQLKTLTAQIKELKESYTEEMAELNKWKESEFVELVSGDCDRCGQALPIDKIEELNEQAMTMFEMNKVEKVEALSDKVKALVTKGKEFVARRTMLELQYTEAQALRAQLEDAYLTDTARVKMLQDMLSETKVIEHIDLSDDEEYQALKAKEDTLRAETEKDPGVELDKLNTERAKIQGQIDKIKELLSTKAVNEKAVKEIAKYTARGKALAGLIAKEKSTQYQCEKFIRAKAELLQDSINGLFQNLGFRLFREQINGGIEDDCTAMINGVEYKDASHSEQIRAGMDIVNAMQIAENTYCPVFVDNAEATTHLRDMKCQVITLYVSEKDKQLRIESEQPSEAEIARNKAGELRDEIELELIEKRIADEKTEEPVEQDLFNFDFN